MTQNLWWMTALLAVLLLTIHSIPGQNLVVDNTSIFLVIIILISPFLSAIRKIKFGDFEAEIDPKEVEKIRNDIGAQLNETQPPAAEPAPEIDSVVGQIRALGENDSVIALAKLRIELEKVVARLHSRTQSGSTQRRPMSLGKMIHDLSSQEILPSGLSGPIREVVSICNRAIHGEEIRERDAEAMLDVGTSLLERLFWFLREYLLEAGESTPIAREEVEHYSNARFRLVTITPYVEEPVQNIRIVDQKGLDDFLEGYHEYAEFMIELTKIE